MNTKSQNDKLQVNPWEEILTPPSGKERIELDTQILAFKFLSLIEKCQDIKKVSRKELAKRIETSPSYITQLFRGDKLPNLEILAKMSNALKFDFQISVSAEDEILDDFKEEELLNTMKKVRSERMRMVLKNTGSYNEELYSNCATIYSICNEELNDENKAIPA